MNSTKKRKTGGLLLGLVLAFHAASGRSDTARLAILVENPTVASAGDLLMAELLKNAQLNLLDAMAKEGRIHFSTRAAAETRTGVTFSVVK